VRAGLSGSALGSKVHFVDLGKDPSASTKGIISFVAERLLPSQASAP
jgi:hypothetical protein